MQELEKILEEIEAEFDRRIDIQLKIMAGLGDDVYRYGYGKSLEAYQQGKLFVEDIIRKYMNDGWIPVEERLPEEPKANPQFEGKKIELYLVTVNGTKYPFRAFWNGKFFADGWSKCEVIAWRPLPEPYRSANKTEATDWREDMLRKFDRGD